MATVVNNKQWKSIWLSFYSSSSSKKKWKFFGKWKNEKKLTSIKIEIERGWRFEVLTQFFFFFLFQFSILFVFDCVCVCVCVCERALVFGMIDDKWKIHWFFNKLNVWITIFIVYNFFSTRNVMFMLLFWIGDRYHHHYDDDDDQIAEKKTLTTTTTTAKEIVQFKKKKKKNDLSLV